MGAALARAFAARGHSTTGWSRSAARRDALGGGCQVAASPADAVAAAELIVACVSDYAATREVLASPGVNAALRGRTFAQLASGGPADARALAGWAAASGVAYLDGAIATYPARIGDAATVIFYSGDESAYSRHEPVLAALGGRPTFVGTAPGGAAAADLAWLSFLYGTMLGLLQGAAFCEAEGVDPARIFEAVPSFQIEIAAEAAYAERLIARRDFKGDQATLDVHFAAMKHIAGSARSSGVDAAFPDVLLDIFGRAVALGHGDDEIAGAIEVLRRP
jgi:3-hydroxyisobutyrate dehydrogenase-like beta-hydroxyacid dehydrogenase